MANLPTNPVYYNPNTSYSLTGTNPLTGTISPVATYGFNLNFIGAALFPQIASTFTGLQASLLNIDASNPAALLQVQLLMSEYENAVQSTSAMYASWETLLKAIIQNI
ncbi:MAG: EscF/YscF/HrpA family type III secretion system needle major subunit [Chthoniobacterales bacterium]|nr:EscF/YscF/HrpA family type III secretion system needle major subunit [Chthoniobacterales bacterium]